MTGAGPWGRTPPPLRRPRTPFLRMMALAAALSALCVMAMGRLWTAIGGAPMSVHGWIALSIAVIGAAVLAVGLMALAFHSSRSGHDERVETGEDR